MVSFVKLHVSGRKNTYYIEYKVIDFYELGRFLSEVTYLNQYLNDVRHLNQRRLCCSSEAVRVHMSYDVCTLCRV